MTEDYPRWEHDLSWMEDETPFRIPAGKKLVCWLLDEETADKLSGPLVVAAPNLLAACERLVGRMKAAMPVLECNVMDSQYDHDAIEDGEAIIAKAKGEKA